MAGFSHAVSCRILPATVLGELEELLLLYGQQDQAALITDQQLPQAVAPDQQFWLLLSSELSVLLTSQPVLDPPRQTQGAADFCQVSLTFEVDAIAQFLAMLLAAPGLPTQEKNRLLILKERLQPASAQAQAELTLALLERLSPSAQPPTCQPVQQALDQQLERSLLLNQVVTKIQESLELSVILQTTVAEVRQFLQADRLLIYQFDLDQTRQTRSMDSEQDRGDFASGSIGAFRHSGYITYESKQSETLPSVLHYTETYCFNNPANGQSDCRLRYLEKKAFAVEDVEATYQQVACLLTFLRQAQVRSKLVAPIIVNHRLWGLLIAHQCSHQRQWQPWEVEFLQHIAEHLAIAINQAQLYQRLQQQTHSLESCVIERTQNLRDALAAAQSANRAKSEFLATMSHELRTPLTYVIGMSATLLRWSFGELSDRQRDYLTNIHNSGEHLLALINDILEVSKIESGRTVLEVKEFSITNLGRQSLDAYRGEAAEHRVDLSLDLKVTPEQDTFVADTRRVRQMLSNLLSNAIKFTPAGGRVTLRIRREQHTLVLQVEDTGIGIPEDLQPLLFEKFQQLENARQRQYQGTGLGLALTKQLVDLHGGSITVTSQAGLGSIFTVRLPMQRPASLPKAPLLELSAEPLLGRVVLLEDNEESAGVICDMLTAAGYQVIWMIEGSRMQQQVEMLHPAAVITNVNLSDVNGYDVIRSLRRGANTVGIKVLALIEGHAPEQGILAQQSGADGVLTKPITPKALLAAMTDLMALVPAQS